MKVKDIKTTSSLPQLEIEILLAYILNTSREHIASHPEVEISGTQLKKFKKLAVKRLKNFPIAYLTEKKDFYDLSFVVNKHVLVPRPETEIIIDYILNQIIQITKNKDNKSYTFLDIGTGSGAIIVTLANAIKNKNKQIFDDSSFLAVDVSSQALKVAKINAKKYKLEKNIEFKKSNLIDKLSSKKLKEKELIITANLPYLTKDEMKEQSISKEPKLALYGGKDGLKYYQELFKMMIKKEIQDFTLICEINPHQVVKIKEMTDKHFKGKKLKHQLIKDYSKQERFYIVKSI